jgi:hypothetical protein
MFFTSDCRRVRDLLWDLASGTVSGGEGERAEAHVAGCEACRNELESYRNTISLMAEYKHDAVPQSQLGWRDVERRVASQRSDSVGWAKRPLMQFAMGGGSLALATAFVMFVMQANMNPPGVRAPANSVQSQGKAAVGAGNDVVSAPRPVDFSAMTGMLAIMQMPPVDDSSVTAIKTAQPHGGHALFAHIGAVNPTPRRSASSAPQTAGNDVNIDGGSPVQALRPDYVLASASSGNDDDQNRRYVIDVVSNSGSSAAAEGSEESHPW